MNGNQKTYTYRLPDGSVDTPDANGQHTKTANVVHSAEEYERFTGCESCQRIALQQAESDDIAAAGFWWNEKSGWRRFARDGSGQLRLADQRGEVAAQADARRS